MDLHAIMELPLSGLDAVGPLGVLMVISIATGALALWVIKITTPQKLLLRCREQIAAAVYETRLFLDSPKQVLIAQLTLVRWSLTYTALTLPGLLLLTPPMLLIYQHLALRYDYAPPAQGAKVLLKVQLAENAKSSPVLVQPQKGLKLDGGPVHSKREGLVYLRFLVQEPGEHTLVLQAGQETVNKVLVAGKKLGETAVSPQRRAGWWSNLIAMTTEEALEADGAVQAVWVKHPEQELEVMGLPWWGFWFLGMTVVAILLRKPMGAVL